MSSPEERDRIISMVDKACRIAQQLSNLGIRKSGVVRIDSAPGVRDWAYSLADNQKQIATTFGKACGVADRFGEHSAAEGGICWGGMQRRKDMIDLLGATVTQSRRKRVGVGPNPTGSE